MLTAAEGTPAAMSALGLPAASARDGWAAVSIEPPVTREVPGSHFTMVAPPHVDAVAAAIRELLPPRPLAPTVAAELLRPGRS
jgi:thioesterase domain-containing protein